MTFHFLFIIRKSCILSSFSHEIFGNFCLTGIRNGKSVWEMASGGLTFGFSKVKWGEFWKTFCSMEGYHVQSSAGSRDGSV